MPLSPEAQERQQLVKIRYHMLQRCLNPKHPSYADYGGRGITVCDEWRESAAAFVRYISPRPKGMTLERIDNDRGYEPGNIRWATRAEQVRNRRNNIIVQLGEERLVLKDACARLGMSYDAIWRRLKRGASLQTVFNTPVQKRRMQSTTT
jgi:hypothetical protein